jgi:hypothetical protein
VLLCAQGVLLCRYAAVCVLKYIKDEQHRPVTEDTCASVSTYCSFPRSSSRKAAVI